jgi:transposase
MSTDGRGATLGPLVEACRPKGKTPPRDPRRAIEAILWRHRNGAKWRSIPAELGPRHRAARLFIRWSRPARHLGAAARPRASARRAARRDLPGRHQRPRPPEGGRRGAKGGSAAGRDRREALGRSRGGHGGKARVIADGAGRRAVAFRVAPGQAQEPPRAVAPLARLPGVSGRVVADRGYASRAFRSHIRGLGARPAIPPQRHEAAVACPEWVYVNRDRVERLWARLKEWRAVATRYRKSAVSSAGVLCLAAALDWLKP